MTALDAKMILACILGAPLGALVALGVGRLIFMAFGDPLFQEAEDEDK